MPEDRINQQILYHPTYQEYFDSVDEKNPFSIHEQSVSEVVSDYRDIMEKFKSHDLIFLLGEPGYGKTTNLKKLHEDLLLEVKDDPTNQTEPNNEKAINSMEAPVDLFANIYLFEGGMNHPLSIIPVDTSLLLFDALDESDNYSQTFRQLVELTRTRKIKILLTSRSHYLFNVSQLIENQSYGYLRLQPFGHTEITQYLTNRLPQFLPDQINIIIQNGGIEVLGIPRYIEGFVTYVNDENLTPNEVVSLTKSELFDKIIYRKMEVAYKDDKETNKIELTKRVLERLAFLMEMNSKTRITKDDFFSFLDLVPSNINAVFLSQIKIGDVLTRDLRMIDNEILFDHTEFQQYLSAKELARLGSKTQTFNDILVDGELKTISSRWLDVLKFSLEIDPAVIRPLLLFIKQKNYYGIDPFLIKMISSLKAANVPTDLHEDVFNTIFTYHTRHISSIWRDVDNLITFTHPDNPLFSLPTISPDYVDEVGTNLISNQIGLIEAAFKKKSLSNHQKEQWTIFLTIILQKFPKSEIRIPALRLLGHFKAISNLHSLKKTFDGDEILYNDYLYELSRSDSYSSKTQNLVLSAFRKKMKLDALSSMLSNIADEKGLLKVISAIKSDLSLADDYTFSAFQRMEDLIHTIDRLYNSKIGRVTEDLLTDATVVKSGFWHSSKFLKSLFHIACLHNTAFITSLSERERESFIQKIIWDMTDKGELGLFNRSKTLLESLGRDLVSIKSKISTQRESRYNIHDPRKNHKKNRHEIETAVNTLRTLMASKDHWLQVPQYILEKKTIIKEELSKQDYDLISKILEQIIKTVDPDKFELTIVVQSENQINFNSNFNGYVISDTFKACMVLGLYEIIKINRVKFVKSLPLLNVYANFTEYEFKNAVEKIGGFSETDIELLTKFCIGRKDDLLMFNAFQFAKTISILNLREFLPFLEAVILSPARDKHDQREAIEAYCHLAETEGHRLFLEKFYQKCSDFKGRGSYEEEPGIIAGNTLVSKFKDRSHIQVRFDLIKSNLNEFDPDRRRNGLRSVSRFESEMDRPKLHNCFLGIENEDFILGFFDLLKKSIEIRSNRLHSKFSSYLIEIAFGYFNSIVSKETHSRVLKFVEQFQDSPYHYLFSGQTNRLSLAVNKQHKKPGNFIDTINVYNEISRKQYLPINSNEDLKNVVYRILDEEIRNLVEKKGFYSVGNARLADGSTVKVSEDLIQKTLSIALEKAFYEKGFRKIDILREVQSYDNLRYDYLINYGLYGPVVVELKLSSNKEIRYRKNRTEYKTKLQKYLSANRGLGIYVVFMLQKNSTDVENFDFLVNEYKDIQGLNILKIDCY